MSVRTRHVIVPKVGCCRHETEHASTREQPVVESDAQPKYADGAVAYAGRRKCRAPGDRIHSVERQGDTDQHRERRAREQAEWRSVEELGPAFRFDEMRVDVSISDE